MSGALPSLGGMGSTHIDLSNRNSLWCGVIAETLVRCGVRDVIISPGSRSTPLTFAFVRHPGLQCVPVLDERSAAFFALGMAKRSRRPVALVCTSGTAAANYLPSIVEAHESGVPLLVFTADRPPEMRACSSGQTIDQQKLYGSMVQYQHEYAVPEAREDLLAYARQTTRHAVERSLYPFPGPVHLNCPFRDPLPPIREEDLSRFATLAEDGVFWDALAPVVRPPAPALPQVPALPPSGLIVAGPTDDFSPARCEEIAALARRLGWPVLADALSPMRQYTGDVPALVTHYDALLRSESLAARLRPAAVLVLDSLPTSKVLRSWLGSLTGVPSYHLSLHPENRDALHASSVHLRGDLPGLIAALPAGVAEPCPRCALWRRADAAARSYLLDSLLAEILPVEPRASWELSRLLPRGTPVFVANSMPVRDLEYFWGPEGRGLEVFFNRGANGIDGTLSTALGIAREGKPAVLITGDLSLLHDSNGFLLSSRIESSLTILLINNHGGGIFGHLAVAGYNPPFEEYFATPQNVDFATLAAAHQVPYERVRDWAHFEQLFSELPAKGVRLLELRTERHHDALLRKQLFASAAGIAERACAV